MATIEFKRLANIDTKFKLAVFGFNRGISDILEASPSSLFQNVPLMIHSLCVLYYAYAEYFDITKDEIDLSSDKKTITKKKGTVYDNTCYGFVKISYRDIGIFRWKIQIIDTTTNMITIGISSNDEKEHDFTAWRMDLDHISYSHYAYNGFLGFKSSIDGTFVYADGFKGGDIVDIALDTMNKQISFYKNGQFQGVAFQDIKISDDISYRLAVSLGENDNSVSLIEFTQQYK